MSYDNGLPVCKIWADKDSSGVRFNYRSPWYEKERGSDSADRETLHSIKLSTLMGTLKKNSVIPDKTAIVQLHIDGFEYAVRNFKNSFGDTQKNLNGITPEFVQSLLANYIGESPNEKLPPLELNICQKILDNYRTVDTIRDRVSSETERAFGNGFYAIGATLNSKRMVVGKLKRLSEAEKSSQVKYELVEDFKRVDNLEEFPQLLALSTMFKVAVEEKYEPNKLCAGFIPVYSSYWADFDVSTVTPHGIPNDFRYAWMLIPCSQT